MTAPRFLADHDSNEHMDGPTGRVFVARGFDNYSATSPLL